MAINRFLKTIFSSIIALIVWPIFLITFILSAGFYLFLALFISPKRLYPIVRIICRTMLLGGGQIIKVEGELPTSKDSPFLYLFNHQSLLDQFVIGAIVKEYLSAVGGDFQFKWPIWGRLIRRIGAIPIARENLTKAIYSLSLAEVEIKNGTSFMISPEGTRTLTGKMGEFKKGPFHLSLNTGVTIIPIGIIGAFRAKNRNDWRIYPGIIRVIIGDPILHSSYKEMSVEELRDDIRARISNLCKHDSVGGLENNG